MAGTRARDAASHDAASEVDGVAAELYGLRLDEFTPARNERAKQARAAGRPADAQAISKLSKPNVVGWLANQLVRAHRDELDPLLELGASLREATSALDAGQLRTLSKQQHQVVYALIQQARELAGGAGQAVTDATARGLEDTLHAALADPEAAAELLSGRLTAGLSRSGFPGVDVTAAAQPVKRGPAKRTSKPDRREQEQQARQAIAEARAAAKAAGRSRDQANRALQRADQVAQAAADEMERLKAELDDATRARGDADRAKREAAKAAERAERLAQAADRRLAEATAQR